MSCGGVRAVNLPREAALFHSFSLPHPCVVYSYSIVSYSPGYYKAQIPKTPLLQEALAPCEDAILCVGHGLKVANILDIGTNLVQKI
jgi:hypothetical protein